MALGVGKVDISFGYKGVLTTEGLMVASVLLVIYFLLNYWTVGLFSKANTFITVFKIVIPGLTIGALLFVGFHSENFTSGTSIAPNGWASVLTTVATSGIVFAFNGFQSPINMAGEAKIQAGRFQLPLSDRFSLRL